MKTYNFESIIKELRTPDEYIQNSIENSLIPPDVVLTCGFDAVQRYLYAIRNHNATKVMSFSIRNGVIIHAYMRYNHSTESYEYGWGIDEYNLANDPYNDKVINIRSHKMTRAQAETFRYCFCSSTEDIFRKQYDLRMTNSARKYEYYRIENIFTDILYAIRIWLIEHAQSTDCIKVELKDVFKMTCRRGIHNEPILSIKVNNQISK